MKRLIVGTDGSDAASAAVDWAARLGAATDSELVVCTALGHPEHEQSAELQRAWDTQRLMEAEWCEPAKRANVPYRAVVAETGAADALLDLAEAEDADLTVVGFRGRGGFGGLHLGSTAHHLAHHTRRPLAMVPASGAQRPFGPLVVGVDGSTGSAAAVAWCAEVAPALGADVVAVHAFEPFVEWVPRDDPRSIYRIVEKEMREEWTTVLRDTGITVHDEVVRDIHPVAAIGQAVASHHAGVVAVGTRGRGGFTGMRLGSVALQLVHATEAPVVLVPPAP